MVDTSGSRQNTTFPVSGGEAHGYLALPPGGSGPGLIVIQEWWGLTDHMASIADRLAAEGFVALAPDLYGGHTTHDPAEAGKMMQSLPAGSAARDLGGAVDFLLSRDDVVGDRVGAVGFCMGGGFVLELAVQQGGKIAAAVAFYPAGQLPEDFAGLQAALMLQIAEQDEFMPPDAVDGLVGRVKAGTGREPVVHRYPAGHAFLNDENLIGTYDPEQAALAWERTVAFLRENLD